MEFVHVIPLGFEHKYGAAFVKPINRGHSMSELQKYRLANGMETGLTCLNGMMIGDYYWKYLIEDEHIIFELWNECIDKNGYVKTVKMMAHRRTASRIINELMQDYMDYIQPEYRNYMAFCISHNGKVVLADVRTAD